MSGKRKGDRKKQEFEVALGIWVVGDEQGGMDSENGRCGRVELSCYRELLKPALRLPELRAKQEDSIALPY
ncbi:hypothetical protein PV327_007502 [Microctonus hyperodae]|uniref:Uncharacterized protein n=1 Tax=Microctonus hyperodae TaxID=165561 RepID=A0AA39FZR3_MICHY|nr:hypothetical protein PV327_007502 [Microctonus hyperodae]